MNTSVNSVLIGAAILVTASGCARDEDRLAEAPAPTTAPDMQAQQMPTPEAWVEDLSLGVASATGSAESTSEFNAGEPVGVTMQLADETPQGTPVTTYWYGPEGQMLSYETKEVPANQENLEFVQQNTHDWESGDYRAEVWISGEKVEEEEFQIVG